MIKTRKQIDVLIVDGSALVRRTLSGILCSDPEIMVIATARDPYVAVEIIKQHLPDVITLDVDMPRMDGITFLHKIMSQHPIPVIICSDLSGNGFKDAMRALSYGAVDVIARPPLGPNQFSRESSIKICNAVKAASRAKLRKVPRKVIVWPKLSADVMLPPPVTTIKTENIIAVGASTGGTEAIKKFLQMLPPDAPGIVIVQHMPENFTRTFAEGANAVCEIEVSEAHDGDKILRGRALIAPGNRHMMVKRTGTSYFVDVKDGPLVNRHRPAVDVLFRSVATYAGINAVGIIMTGMGDDGARGLLEMKQCGAQTIAQDEASCVVFGMPGEAIKLGGADLIIPLDHIANAALSLAGYQRS